MSSVDAEETVGLDKLQPGLNEIVDYLKQSHSRQEKYRLWNRLATITAVIVFIIYIILFYQLFSKNMSAENFAANLQNSVEELAPVITDASIEVITQVSPVYLDLAAKKVDAMLPTFMNSLEKQTDIFITDMSGFAEKELQAALERVVKQVAVEFRKEYPDLTDEQLEKFIDETEEDFILLFAHLSEKIVNQSLPSIMEMKLITEDLTDKDMPEETMEIYRLFLHKLLMLLDREIMEG